MQLENKERIIYSWILNWVLVIAIIISYFFGNTKEVIIPFTFMIINMVFMCINEIRGVRIR